ncbi:fungal-specific transcription factor domain-containing protein [Exophiala viscosa]|uniref:fungal-specific transcription factor domain-containing protein n=1 Tax=Exophiala viscosa TaxID=2486360 RepID=UPI002190FDE5|nr:fungal-specific transcription factor domain-containing protein [Exophiala viscosa]
MPRSRGLLVDLDTSERAPQDCKTCKTRRVRCDRTTPSCRKCRGRRLECPGYPSGILLRWTNVVASKGRPKSPRSVQQSCKESTPSPTRQSSSPDDPVEDDNGATLQAPVSRFVPLEFDCPSRPTASPFDLSFSSYSALEGNTAHRLLHHYSTILSSKLPWIDSFDNPWRSIILPMAMNSPSVMFSVLSMAAEDLTSKLDHVSVPNNFSHDATTYRQKAIELLTCDMTRGMTHRDHSSANPETITMTLAAALILCNLEIRQTHSTTWHLHLRAAHAIIQYWETTSQSRNPMSATNVFLIQKFFSMKVFASMSTFEDTEDILTYGLKDQSNSVFLEFLRIMQDITHEQRHKPLRGSAETHREGHKCQQLQHKLSMARQTVLKCNEIVLADSATTKCDLENIVDMFYHAGLIYSHQALVLRCCSDALSKWRNEILSKFDLLNEVDRFCQNLVWPLFIAGTQACADGDGQRAIEANIRQTVTLSGHWNGLRVLDFLNELWRSGHPRGLDWIPLAKDWAKKGNGFIVI